MLFYSQISKISIKRNGITDGCPNGIFVNLKIMHAPFRFFCINGLIAFPLNYDLRF
jgi:hypothetical protein